MSLHKQKNLRNLKLFKSFWAKDWDRNKVFYWKPDTEKFSLRWIIRFLKTNFSTTLKGYQTNYCIFFISQIKWTKTSDGLSHFLISIACFHKAVSNVFFTQQNLEFSILYFLLLPFMKCFPAFLEPDPAPAFSSEAGAKLVRRLWLQVQKSFL